MSRCISIWLAGILLLQGAGISSGDLLQIEELIEHAAYHAETYDDDLFEFFAKHYGSLEEDHRQEHSDHEQLPLKHQHCSHINWIFVRESGLEIPLLTKSPAAIRDNFHYENSYSLINISSIFQPPKAAC
ncbi:hypothetical protein [Robertkochia aurantiaca]|uniref:hypothetical protein n=1 Tax=Robertkochia aurantiaca TaxID=2873700 RepID=UPI001CCE79F7|nr:hypothetical protein [Robertkochia sp. 3YJGBD-33]